MAAGDRVQAFGNIGTAMAVHNGWVWVRFDSGRRHWYEAKDVTPA
jgi:hypothetical protein